MRRLHLLGAFVFGAVLQWAVVCLAGFSAALAVPASYFAWFGRENGPLALALLHGAVFSVPAALLVAAGVLAARRLFAGSTRAVLAAVFCGLLARFVFDLVTSAVGVAGQTQRAEPLALSELLGLSVRSWWLLTGYLAPWAGFALAVWWVRRRERPVAGGSDGSGTGQGPAAR